VAVVRVIHWRAAEAAQLIDACRGARFEVDYLAGDAMAVCRATRNKPPDVIGIDLSRLPSHGREVAIWLRNTKATRDVPILFVGGDSLKVAPIRELLPDAAYCEISHVGAAIKRLAKSARKRDLVTPPAIMQRPGEKSAAQKLGIEAGAAVAVIEPPRDFPDLLGPVPESVGFREQDAAVTLWFVHDREGLLDSLRRMRAIATRTRLWLLWRKGSSGDGLTQNSLRETMREVGLVDYKICSVDARWSGMLFTRKKV
jgi:CheY-like chemotaxis protein